MKKSLFIICVFSFLVLEGIAQKTEIQLQSEIDSLVWIPFVTAFSNLDVETYNSLHTEDVLRAGSWSIRRGEEYRESNRSSFAKNKASNKPRSLELKFDMRKTLADISYETGFYKSTYIPTNEKEPRSSYGYFHVVIKKVKGRWLIAQDWDDHQFNGIPIDETHFQKAKGAHIIPQ